MFSHRGNLKEVRVSVIVHYPRNLHSHERSTEIPEFLRKTVKVNWNFQNGEREALRTQSF